MLEQESFWAAKCYVVVTDKTKPAMRMTIDELTMTGKKVFVVDMSDKPEPGTFRGVSELPSEVDYAVIGLTKVNAANVIEELKIKGAKRFWIHWRTDTPEVKKKCTEPGIQCITGRCPMMYLSRGLNVHSIHRRFAKLLGKY